MPFNPRNVLGLTPLGRILLCCVLAPYGSPLWARAPHPLLDEMRLLTMIAQVETGTRNLSRAVKKRGRAGERSAWQFKAATWRAYTALPFVKASTDAPLAHLVASLHLRRLRMELESHGYAATPYRLAVAWNKGLAVALTDQEMASDYARRVCALYDE